MKIMLTIRLLRFKFGVGIFCASFCLSSLPSFSQISSVTSVQNLSFGAFSQGSLGGTISISTDGSRSVTGSIVPLNFGVNYFQAIFEIEAPEGTVISIMNGGNVTLNGSNGGSMMLQIGNSDPASPFAITIPPPGKTRVNFGGTLTIGSPAQNPPGNYSGTFSITFNNE
jgi:hypothetical protein